MPSKNTTIYLENLSLAEKGWAYALQGNPIYVFLFWELRGLSPNFHIHVSVSNIYNPRIFPHISLQQNRQTNPGNI